LQATRIYRLKSRIPDKLGGFVLRIAIIAAIEDRWRVAAEQMRSGLKNFRKYRIKRS
jgi:hypothetical protein